MIKIEGSGYLAKAFESARDGIDKVIKERVRAVALGQKDFGQYGSASDHYRYSVPAKSRRRCACGNKTTHTGRANGVALMGGCEWCVGLWVDVTPQQ